MTGPDVATRHVVVDRASGRCEIANRHPAEVIHHRRLRGMGGSTVEWINSPANLLVLCCYCHGHVHSQPSESYEAGRLVSYADHPAEVPVWLWRGVVLLDDDGGWKAAR